MEGTTGTVQSEAEEKILAEEDVVEEVDPKQKIPGTKLTYGEADRLGIPEQIVAMITHFAQAVAPRKLGLVTVNGEWFIYRNLSRQEFKVILKETTDRTIKKAEQAEAAGQPVNAAFMQAETQAYLEERVAVEAVLHPKLSLARMGEYDAGLPKLLNDAVMARSGFEQNAQPIVL